MDLNGLNGLLALAPPPQPGTKPNPVGQFLQMMGPLVAIAVMFYFVMIRPQQKRAKEHSQLLQTLKPGDRIVTTGGILGVVVAVKEKSVSIRSADTKLEVLKGNISEILEKAPGSVES